MKSFDLRHVLAVLNSFTEATRELVMGILQEIKRRDDDFTQQLYQVCGEHHPRWGGLSGYGMFVDWELQVLLRVAGCPAAQG